MELLVMRLSWDVLAATRVRDDWRFLRATLEVDGGGIAIESSNVSANKCLPLPPFVLESLHHRLLRRLFPAFLLRLYLLCQHLLFT